MGTGVAEMMVAVDGITRRDDCTQIVFVYLSAYLFISRPICLSRQIKTTNRKKTIKEKTNDKN